MRTKSQKMNKAVLTSVAVVTVLFPLASPIVSHVYADSGNLTSTKKGTNVSVDQAGSGATNTEGKPMIPIVNTVEKPCPQLEIEIDRHHFSPRAPR